MSDKISFLDVILEISKDTKISQNQVRKLLLGTSEIANIGLKEDKSVNLNGFGKFSVKWRKARSGRNPQTGETIEIPAHNLVTFSPGGKLKDYINRKYNNLEKKQLVTKSTEKVEIPKFKENKIIETEVKTIESGDKIALPKNKIELKDNKDKSLMFPKKKKKNVKFIWAITLFLLILLVVFNLIKNDPDEKSLSKVEIANINKPIEKKEDDERIESQTTTTYIEKKQKERINLVEKYKIKKSGENFWNISNFFYKNPYYWPYIYRQNDTIIPNPDILIKGKIIGIPYLQNSTGNLSEEDINNIADGYFKVYLVYKKLGKEKAIYYLWVAKKLDKSQLYKKYKKYINKDDILAVDAIIGNTVILK